MSRKWGKKPVKFLCIKSALGWNGEVNYRHPANGEPRQSPVRAFIWLGTISLSVNILSSVHRFKLTKIKPKVLVHNGDLLRRGFEGVSDGGSEHRNKNISNKHDGYLVLAGLLWRCRVVVNVTSRCSGNVQMKVPVTFTSHCSSHLSHPQRAALHCALQESKEPSHS